MKTALVLGGGGFIGGHLAKRLKNEGFWVRVVDIKEKHEFWNHVGIRHEYFDPICSLCERKVDVLHNSRVITENDHGTLKSIQAVILIRET